jgi:repressor LexA
MKNQERLSSKELEAIRSIRNLVVHHGRTPSVRELMLALGYKSPRSAQVILDKLELKGIINRSGRRGFRLVADRILGPGHAKTVNVPLLGCVACGAPILAQENVEAYFSISTTIAKPGFKYYLLKASGDSMNLVGIEDGDVVLVRQQDAARNGEKVVALIDEEATIKEFQRSDDVVVLRPRSNNKVHRPIILSDNFRIQGVVVATIRNLV